MIVLDRNPTLALSHAYGKDILDPEVFNDFGEKMESLIGFSGFSDPCVSFMGVEAFSPSAASALLLACIALKRKHKMEADRRYIRFTDMTITHRRVLDDVASAIEIQYHRSVWE